MNKAKVNANDGVWVAVECPICRTVIRRTTGYLKAVKFSFTCPKCMARAVVDAPNGMLERLGIKVSEGNIEKA